jgi:hypothetical protein
VFLEAPVVNVAMKIVSWLLFCLCFSKSILLGCGDDAKCEVDSLSLYPVCRLSTAACEDKEGSVGCACRLVGDACDDMLNVFCVDNVCRPLGCPPGSAGCECFRDKVGGIYSTFFV